MAAVALRRAGLVFGMGLGLGAGAVPALHVTGVTLGETHRVSELGRSVAVSLSLEDAPAADVSIAMTATVAGQVEFLPVSPIVITAADPTAVKTLVVRGLDNETKTANADFNVVFTTSSGDAAYNNLTQSFSFKNENNEAESGNAPPSDIVVFDPKDATTGVTHNSKYIIELPFDSDDKDVLTLTICRDTDEEFEVSPQCSDVAGTAAARKFDPTDVMFASVSVLMLALLSFLGGSKRQFLVLGIGLLVAGSCGKQKLIDSFDLTPRPRWSVAINGLTANTEYFWKAYVSDGHGNIKETPTYSFTSGATP